MPQHTISTIVNSITTRLSDGGDESVRTIPKLVHSTPSTFGNLVVEEARDRMPELGYRCYTSEFADRPLGRNPFEALDLAHASRDDWRRELRREVPADVVEGFVVGPLGGTGTVANLASPFPLDRIGHPITNVHVMSHKLKRDRPGTQEAVNAAIALQLLDEHDAHLLLEHLRERVGHNRTVNEIGTLVSLLPLIDCTDFAGSVLTAALVEIDLGNSIRGLHEALQHAVLQGHEDPWFDPADYAWWDGDVASPLKGAHAGTAAAVLPRRFEGENVDVAVAGAPDIDETTFAPVDNGYVVVFRAIEHSFLDRIREESIEWLRAEIADGNSAYGDEWRRLVNARPTTRGPAEMLEELLEDL